MSETPRVTLFVIPGSHPACAARRMLEHKGIAHREVSLLSGFHPLLLRLNGFKGRTVPALRVGRERVQGSLAIARALERLRPEPRLFPADPIRRKEVEEAERWGESVLQPMPRRLYRWALVRDQRVRRELAGFNHLPLPDLAGWLMKPLAAWFARDSGADDDTIRADLARLPALLEKIDGWLADGRLGAATPGAADFQIAPSLRMLCNFEDLRGYLADRPSVRMARRLVPDYPGEIPRVFPPGWLTGLSSRPDPSQGGEDRPMTNARGSCS